MDRTSDYTKACMEAWLHCENLLLILQGKEVSFSNRTIQVIDECAQVCLGTYECIKELSSNVYKYALLCFGICEECAEICDKYEGEAFQKCAAACRRCSSAIADLASSAV
jgi:hypothetical protein